MNFGAILLLILVCYFIILDVITYIIINIIDTIKKNKEKNKK